MAFRILDLPPEIREHIYEECLRLTKVPDDDGLAHYEKDMSILRVNKLMHREAKRIFEEQNVFLKISTPWPEATNYIFREGKVPLLTTGRKAVDFSSVHLHIRIDTPMFAMLGDRHSMIILLEDLPSFTQLWKFADLHNRGLNCHLELHLSLQDPYIPGRKIPKALQQKLLMPFGVIKGLEKLEVDGMVLPSVKEALHKETRLPQPTPEECLDKASDLKDEGNELINQKKYKEALQKYFDAFKAMHILVNGRLRTVHADGYFAQELKSGKFFDQRGDYVRMLLRVKLVANIVLTYIKLEDYEEAHFWGKRTILLFQQSITDQHYAGYPSVEDWIGTPIVLNFGAAPEMGKIYYRTAQAARGLRKEKEVPRLLRAAAGYLPTDEAVKKELALAEGRDPLERD